jgi:zinc transport system substrate-binding protein
MSRLNHFHFVPAFLALVACGCQSRPDGPPGAKQLTVAVTVLPHAWLVQQIAGDHVKVVSVVQPGESAELYQPTDAQVNELVRAAALFCTGMPFEESRTMETLRSAGSLRVVDLRQGIELRDMPRHAHLGEEPDEHDHAEHDSHNHSGKDPHIWLSPRLLKTQAQTVAKTLQELDPPHRDDYAKNLAALEKRLNDLDRSIGEKLAPMKGKAFFVVHPAWGYFAADYGLREVAVEIEGKEPSDRELTELQTLARREGVKSLFVQPQSPRRAAEAIASAIGARLEVLDDLAADLDEALLKIAERIAASGN